MCRLLGYVGLPIQLDRLLIKPEHSLIVQSYQPREMTAGLLNADGYGVGWYHPTRREHPYLYRSILPIWNDINLPHLSRYIESDCVIASIRSATPGLAVDLSNCPPFQQNLILAAHNGFIERFRQTLYRPIRDRLSDELYQSIHGNTDSEHLLALILSEHQQQGVSLELAIERALTIVFELAEIYQVSVAANLLISDGDRLIACRAANRTPMPSLYWLRDDPLFPEAVVIASEPLFTGAWAAVSDRSILTVGKNLELQIQSF
jgi:glutamine amidotransferase